MSSLGMRVDPTTSGSRLKLRPTLELEPKPKLELELKADRPWPCPYCPSSHRPTAFQHVNALRQHVVQVHGGTCQACGYAGANVTLHAWRHALSGDWKHTVFVVLTVSGVSRSRHCREWLRGHRQEVYASIFRGTVRLTTPGDGIFLEDFR